MQNQAIADETTQAITESLHRFIISGEGVIGLNITLQTKTKTCLVSNVHPCSRAVGYGVQVNDEILHPNSNAGNDPGTYDLFLEAVKRRPILFHVRRPVTEVGTKFISHTLHALHRFVITRTGSIGMTLGEKGNLTYVQSVIPNSSSDIHGIFKDDIVCKPFTNGAETENIFHWICDNIHLRRPLVVEVWRPVSTAGGMMPPPRANENPFIFLLPQIVQRDEEVPATSTRHAAGPRYMTTATSRGRTMEIAKSNTPKESAPVILLVDDSDDDPEDSSDEEKKKDSE